MCIPLEVAHTKQLLKGVGGKPPNKYGHSFTINFPFSFKDDKKEKSAIQSILLKFFTNLIDANNLDMKREDIINHIQDNNFYNIHKQEQGSMMQFNFVLSEYIKDVKLDLSKKKYSFLLKNIAIEVARAKGYDINEYVIKTNKPTAKKKIPINKSKLDKQRDALNEYKSSIDTILEDLEEKVEKRVLIYLNRMDKALEENNQEKFDKNMELVNKNIKDVILSTKRKSSFDIDI
ncbi:MAG: hypothetical protein NTW78_00940 [Campylobacterales bacterium]|nr:hypothetical protein [Campylobacterales bacterium]